MRYEISAAIVLCLGMSSSGCERHVPLAQRASATEATASSPAERITPYPHARWRLSQPRELERALLWVSHIVVRHQDVSMPGPCFSLADWHSPSPGTARSRTEALALARQLRAQAARAPESFAELATAHSEDVATQAYGGSLGGVAAAALTFWPEVLDALAAIPAGGVSEVVETVHGFHVFQRRPPPAEATVSAAHIVVAHSDAGWLHVLARGPVPGRSRADALALANGLYEQAKANPDAFSELVKEHSSHVDALAGGDMGSWSTREPSHYSREVEALAALAVGEVAPPMDSPVGFQILLRTPNRPRPTYAMEQVRLSFDPGRMPPDPSSEPLVLAHARELAVQLRSAPARFRQLQQELCCLDSEQWQDGRGAPRLTQILSGLAPGEIAAEPARSGYSYVIAKRAEPAPLDTAFRHELPAPEHPDIKYFFGYSEISFADTLVTNAGGELAQALGVPREIEERVATLHRAPGRFQNLDSGEARVAAFERLLGEVEQALGPRDYPRYLELLTARFERALLAQ